MRGVLNNTKAPMVTLVSLPAVRTALTALQYPTDHITAIKDFEFNIYTSSPKSITKTDSEPSSSDLSPPHKRSRSDGDTDLLPSSTTSFSDDAPQLPTTLPVNVNWVKGLCDEGKRFGLPCNQRTPEMVAEVEKFRRMATDPNPNILRQSIFESVQSLSTFEKMHKSIYAYYGKAYYFMRKSVKNVMDTF